MSPLELRGDGPPVADDEARIARLLSEAGPAPPAPELEIARLQESARAEWRRRYGGRRPAAAPRWAAALAAALALCALAGLWLARDRRADGAPARLASVARSAPGATLDGRPLVAGASIAAGGVVRTGAAGGVALALAGGRSLRLDAGSELVLASAGELELAQGALYLDSGGTAAAGAPVIRTDLGTFREAGTQFELRLLAPDVVRLRVREGAVRFGDAVEVPAGEELRVDRQGRLERAPVARHAADWSWAVDAAPRPAIEGWTLERYLGWIARECGYELRYETAADEALARTVVLHGSIERLTPAQSLPVVLDSAGFEHRLLEGELRLARGGPPPR